MPVLSPLFASVLDTSTTSGTFTQAVATSALADGVTYLVLVTASAISDENDSTTELEATFGGTRYAGAARNRPPFGAAPDAATGASLQAVFRVTGNGSDVVAVNFRRLDGPGNTDHFCTAHVACIPISSLTLNTHYWVYEATNSDTLTVPGASSGWASQGSVDVTPGATGNFLIVAQVEGEHEADASAGSDFIALRGRVTEDPTGSPTSYNLQRNTTGTPNVEGPEYQIDYPSWGEYAITARFLDVLSLTSGTTYRFAAEYEGNGGNVGYRRSRVYVFDLSVWPEFAFVRDLNAQQQTSPGPATFGNASASAPGSTQDFVLLGQTSYANNTTWMRAVFDLDPTGTPSEVPSSSGFGVGAVNTGSTTADDFMPVAAQWHQASVTAAQTIGLRVDHDNADTPVGQGHGDTPNNSDPDDGIASLVIAWGMETDVVSPITGTGGGTLGALTSSSAGDVDIDGSSAETLEALTSSSAGDVDITGTGAATLGDATSSAAGDVLVAGTGSELLDDATAAGAGTVRVAGISAETLDDVAAAGSGVVDVSGTAAETLDNVATTSSGSVDVDGAGAETLGDLVASSAGSVDVDGSTAETLDALTAAGVGSVGEVITGTGGGTLDDVTSSAAGDVDVTGTGAEALNDLVASSAGSVLVDGSSSSTLDDATVAGVGTVAGGDIEGTGGGTLGDATASSSGAVDVDGTASSTLGDATSSAAGAVDIDGSSAETLGPVTAVGVGTTADIITGSGGGTLGELAAASSGDVLVDGAAAETLEDAAGSGAGLVVVDGASSPELDDVASSGAGTVSLTGIAAATLGALASVAAGAVLVVGSGSSTLGETTLVATDFRVDFTPPGTVAHTPAAHTVTHDAGEHTVAHDADARTVAHDV